jgi:hypothetical protein
MESEGSLPCSQDPATGHYSDYSHPFYLSNNGFNISLLSTPSSSR